MNINFADFITAFSSALDLLNPENPHHSARRAYITERIARHRGLNQPVRHRLFIAALLRDINNALYLPAGCAPGLSNITLLAESAGLICRTGINTPEGCLLQLADDLSRLSLNEYPDGHYPERTMQTLCDSIGVKYTLDDVIALRELGLNREFWQQLASPSLKTDLARFMPAPPRILTGGEMLQLSGLLARVIDTHCGPAVGHSFKVAELSGQLAELYGFSRSGIENIQIAGLLHDLGKLALPVSLLTQKAPLTDVGRRQLHYPPLYTWGILSAVSGMRDIAQNASFHHERLDGKGYPFRLQSAQLDLSSRIVSVADNFAALTEKCGDRAAYTPEISFDMLEENARSGGLDPAVVGALKTCFTAADAGRVTVSPVLS